MYFLSLGMKGLGSFEKNTPLDVKHWCTVRHKLSMLLWYQESVFFGTDSPATLRHSQGHDHLHHLWSEIKAFCQLTRAMQRLKPRVTMWNQKSGHLDDKPHPILIPKMKGARRIYPRFINKRNGACTRNIFYIVEWGRHAMHHGQHKEMSLSTTVLCASLIILLALGSTFALKKTYFLGFAKVFF